MNVLQVIPARGGSKGIPLKNIAPLAGKPLIWWTLDAAAEAGYPTVVSTDSPDIVGTVRRWVEAYPTDCEVTIQERRAELAQDDTPTEAVIEDMLDRWSGTVDIVVLLQPTSPLRTGAQIVDVVTKLCDRNLDSIFSVSPSHAFIWYNGPEDGQLYSMYNPKKRPRRQDMTQYEENGALYAFTYDLWRKEHYRIGGRMGMYVMGEEHRLQIDTPTDLFIAEKLLGRLSCASVNMN